MEHYTPTPNGVRSKYAYVEFNGGIYWDEQREKFVDRTDLIPGLGGLEMEEMAMMLAEKVERNFPGKGRDAFESAKLQLLDRDFNGEWKELCRRIKVHKLWGGPVAAAIILPSIENDNWNCIVPDQNGIPISYNVRYKAFEDVVPHPVKTGNAVKTDQGWYTKK